jgi:hypothetical protein
MTLKEITGLNFQTVMESSKRILVNSSLAGAVILDPTHNGPILMVMAKLISFVMIIKEITGLCFQTVMASSRRISANI